MNQTPTEDVGSNWYHWWRRRESNPRPERYQQKFLHA